ncbi:MAG TPA: long-chain fatty acid--CoA ligase [bacterium]|nr:long-chain fatty acid--CoA ligase [bacterium]
MEPRPWHRFYADDVPHDIAIPDAPLQGFLSASAARHPRRAAVILSGPGFYSALTYRALDRAAGRFAAGLRALGLGRGDRLAIALANLPQYPIAMYGAFKAGVTAVQVNPLYRGEDLAFVLRDSQAKALVTLTRLYPNVAAVRAQTALEHVILTKLSDCFPPLWRVLYRIARERREGDSMPGGPGLVPWGRMLRGRALPDAEGAGPDDLAVLQYTGGTTGRPRGAMLTHRNLAVNAAQGLAWFRDLRDGEECFLLVAPLFHVYGLLVLNAGIRLAATNLMVLMRMFEARLVAEQVPRWRPTVFPGVPAMYAAINQLKDVARHDLHSIRYCLSGAAGLPAEVARRFEELTGGRVAEGYGLTEAGPLVAANPIWEGGVRKAGSIGIPVPGTDVRIVDLETGRRDLPVGEPGELIVRGPQVMQGFWNGPAETATALRDGWLYTGDVARLDNDGFLFIEDRKKDMIEVGGLKVYPREIEDLLLEHPLVRDAAVVGVPHQLRGETIIAYLTLRTPGAGDVVATRRQVRDWLRERLPSYKVPRRIEIVDAIPKTLIGKPLRRVLRETAASAPPVDDGAGDNA